MKIREMRVLPRLQKSRGMTVVEIAVALVILMAAMVALAQLVSQSARQRRQTEQRRLALQEVANQAERIAILSWDDTARDKLTTWQPSAGLTAAIPQAACEIQVSDDSRDPPSRCIQLRVTWTDAAGRPVNPAELTLWKFRPEASE